MEKTILRRLVDMRFRTFISMHSNRFIFLQSDWSILNGKKMFISAAKENALIFDYSDQLQALVSGGVRMEHSRLIT
jgi:hypothetical protein